MDHTDGLEVHNFPMRDVIDIANKLTAAEKSKLGHHLNNALAIAAANIAILSDLEIQDMPKDNIVAIVKDARHGMQRVLEISAILTGQREG